MAGSFSHVIDDNGALFKPEQIKDMLDTTGDFIETIQHMYGMIWFLADKLSKSQVPNTVQTSAGDWVEIADLDSKVGLSLSPSAPPRMTAGELYDTLGSMSSREDSVEYILPEKCGPTDDFTIDTIRRAEGHKVVIVLKVVGT